LPFCTFCNQALGAVMQDLQVAMVEPTEKHKKEEDKLKAVILFQKPLFFDSDDVVHVFSNCDVTV
jgi:hypothetical protein